MSLGSRARTVARVLVRLLKWPFAGELEHSRPSPEEAEQRLREMTLANRDQSR
jgi:hypothetical protein